MEKRNEGTIIRQNASDTSEHAGTQKTGSAGPLTMRASEAFSVLTRSVPFIYTRRDFQSVLARLKNSRPAGRMSLLSRLYAMLETCNIPFMRDQDWRYYRDLISAIQFPSPAEAETRLMQSILQTIETYPTPSNLLQTLVDHLESPNDAWNSDSLRLRILKQFIRHGDFLTRSGFGSRKTILLACAERIGHFPNPDEVIDALCDADFSCLEQADRARRKHNGPYGLFKAVDDLTKGIVRTQNGSVQILFLFGICYGMKFDDGTMHPSYYQDFELRIFQEYYTNNLMRFFEEGQAAREQAEPSGRGINFKNPHELIYLYWMNQPGSPAWRLQQAEKMNKALKKAAATHSDENGRPDFERQTRQAEELFRTSHMSQLSADDFLSMLMEHYPIDTTQSGMMSHCTDENTAWTIYCSVRTDFLETLILYDDSIAEHCYGLYFLDSTDIPSSIKIFAVRTGQSVESMSIQRFERMLTAMNRVLGGMTSLTEERERSDPMEEDGLLMDAYFRREFRRVRRKEDPAILEKLAGVDPDAPDFDLSGHLDLLSFLIEQDSRLPAVWRAAGPQSVSRTRLLGILYYSFNLSCDLSGEGGWKSLNEVFEAFKRYCNPVLTEALYLPVSVKSVFDVLLIYSSFARINF